MVPPVHPTARRHRSEAHIGPHGGLQVDKQKSLSSKGLRGITQVSESLLQMLIDQVMFFLQSIVSTAPVVHNETDAELKTGDTYAKLPSATLSVSLNNIRHFLEISHIV